MEAQGEGIGLPNIYMPTLKGNMRRRQLACHICTESSESRQGIQCVFGNLTQSSPSIYNTQTQAAPGDL